MNTLAKDEFHLKELEKLSLHTLVHNTKISMVHEYISKGWIQFERAGKACIVESVQDISKISCEVWVCKIQ